jgi:hypothetical protein
MNSPVQLHGVGNTNANTDRSRGWAEIAVRLRHLTFESESRGSIGSRNYTGYRFAEGLGNKGDGVGR